MLKSINYNYHDSWSGSYPRGHGSNAMNVDVDGPRICKTADRHQLQVVGCLAVAWLTPLRFCPNLLLRGVGINFGPFPHEPTRQRAALRRRHYLPLSSPSGERPVSASLEYVGRTHTA